jgi:hypothetical protein
MVGGGGGAVLRRTVWRWRSGRRDQERGIIMVLKMDGECQTGFFVTPQLEKDSRYH